MNARQEDTASLFHRHASKMKVVAQLILGDNDEADDAVGDVFADVATGCLLYTYPSPRDS